MASPVARSFNLATHSLASHPQTPIPASIVAIAMQPTAPIVPTPTLQASQTSVISLPPELIQQSAPQPSVLPEQHGLTAQPYAEPSQPPIGQPATGSPAYWSHEPVEWSPLAQMPAGAGNIPAHATDYLNRQPPLAQMPELEPESELAVEEEQPRKKGRWLPVLVLILLLLGLLAALLSSFLLPPSPSHGTGLRASPSVASSQVSAQKTQLGG
jgi:hypothetical protein